ncbi:alpha/beta fold hydrolase [Candidatus Woesearchaeota archaeon]|nr:alpha/beta fold hydrolase [Candidatus Woesearchaeota archaeon]
MIMQEKLFFENSKGNKLCGILSNPTASKDRPIIILCHGFSSSKDSKTFVELEKILNEKGISTFRFDFYGHGESEGKFEDVTISEAVDDVLNAIKFLKQKGYKKIGLMGSSFGGMASLLAASKTNDLYVLALKSPVSDYLREIIAQISKYPLNVWKKQGFIYYTNSKGNKFRLNYSFFEDAKTVSGYEAAKKIKIPTLIVHGDKDESVPIEQSIKTAKLIKNCKLEIIKGADHRYTNPEHFEKMLSLVSGFIIENS